MPNDAKLGLLAGVIGVIAVAVVSASRPAPAEMPGKAAPVASAPSASTSIIPAVDAIPTLDARSAEPVSTPVARTRTESTGTPTSRVSMDDIER